MNKNPTKYDSHIYNSCSDNTNNSSSTSATYHHRTTTTTQQQHLTTTLTIQHIQQQPPYNNHQATCWCHWRGGEPPDMRSLRPRTHVSLSGGKARQGNPVDRPAAHARVIIRWEGEARQVNRQGSSKYIFDGLGCWEDTLVLGLHLRRLARGRHGQC